jgi:RNA polymerase sigma-70 factor (ECF subfamily)
LEKCGLLSDEDLLAKFLDGDPSAFDELMARHEDRIFGLCLRMLASREDALDATQDTFLTLYRKGRQYSGRSRLSTWLYRVAINTCHDHLRKRSRRHTTPMPEGSDPPDASVQDMFDSVELRPDIVEALAAIPKEFRSAVLLVDVEGLALEEAADILRIPLGTVKSRTYRGRRLLAEHLGNFRDAPQHQRGEDHA